LSRSTLTAPFATAAKARAAVEALVAAGVPRDAISLTVPAAAAAHEGRFLGRIAVLIVIWSIPGGAVGALLGLALALAGIGPDGSAGTFLQVVSWLIIGHLLAGMWAGYVLLADRAHRELAPGRQSVFVVSVRCSDDAEAKAARRLLNLKVG